jgi:drug/metabolite transporter (DMT)-like permease
MVLASASYVASATLTRDLGGRYSAFELTFLRSVVGVLVMAPVLLQGGIDQLRTTQFPLHILRAFITYLAILLWFYAAETVPVGDFFALQFTTPLFTIGAAWLLLRERVGTQSWLAALVGFAGVLIILRPGFHAVTLGMIAAIGTSLCYAGVNTVIKMLSRKDSPATIVFYSNFLILLLAAIPAFLFWTTPTLADAPVLLGVTLFATLAQYSVACGISAADARVVQPVNFLRLPFAALLGYLFFQEFPDVWTWVGAIVIFAAAYYAVFRAKAA